MESCEMKLGQLLVCNMYRTPNASKSWMDYLASTLRTDVQENIVIELTGDFNSNLARRLGCKAKKIVFECGFTLTIQEGT